MEEMSDDAMLRLTSKIARTEFPHEKHLTERERRALQAVAVGLRWREAAEVYGVSPYTIRRQLLTARRKLRAKNTTHAVALAFRAGLIH